MKSCDFMLLTWQTRRSWRASDWTSNDVSTCHSRWAQEKLRPQQNGKYSADDTFTCIFTPQLRSGWVLSYRSGRRWGWAAARLCRAHISETTAQIYSIQSPLELSRPAVGQRHSNLPICPMWVCLWAKNFLAATKQLNEWYFLSVCHTFLTMFPLSYHHEIFRSYH